MNKLLSATRWAASTFLSPLSPQDTGKTHFWWDFEKTLVLGHLHCGTQIKELPQA
jgi:hypothetical protein